MILNVSGRTDIIAFYTPWFLNRLKEGYVDVINPIIPSKTNRIYFKDVKGIVFCTKNPLPIIPYIKDIKIPILFHVTITPYKKDIEPNVPDKRKIIEGIKELSKILGKDRLYIRYDPFFISNTYSLEYHKKAFQKLTRELDGYISHVIFSFLDNYKNVLKNQGIIQAKSLSSKDYQEIGILFSKIAKEHHMTIQTCSEEENLSEYGFLKRDCLDKNLAYALTKQTDFKRWQGRNNKFCHCVKMVDIGSYNTCPHLCKYCYANYKEEDVITNYKNHDISSSFLIKTTTQKYDTMNKE